MSDEEWEGRMASYIEQAEKQIAALRAALDQERAKWAALDWRTESLGVQHHGFWFAFVPNKHGDIEKDMAALLSGRGEAS